MKNFAKQTILFCISFLIIFLTAVLFRFLALRVGWAMNLPPKPETTLTLLITSAHWALSLALFFSILFSLCYSARQEYSALMTVFTIMGLSLVFCLGISFLLDNWKSVPPAQSPGIPLGGKGLMLSNSLHRNETVVVLLNGASQPLGPRVTALPGQPMIYLESVNAGFDLPSIPFRDDTPWFLKSLSIDIRLNAGMFQEKYSKSLLSFLIYAGSLIFLLCSLGNVIKFSAWPLANLFLGILAFRGILSFCSFINTPEMQEIISSFVKGIIPLDFAVPFMFLSAGLLLHLYSFLIFIIKRRSGNDA
ncbi:MAG: hypothetical protein FWC19_04565 [Treponema sp.]|nr:hypothetical protein [Treponema sp.]MCL2272063.1 hypothetical protein [Treponema sp.]